MTLSTQKDPGWMASSGQQLMETRSLTRNHSHLIAHLNPRKLNHLTQSQVSRMINIFLVQAQRRIPSKSQVRANKTLALPQIKSHHRMVKMKVRKVRKTPAPLFKLGSLDSSNKEKQML